jgi:alkylhydroperoxidase/carboxymuconolactone decarboxylase family protein YurZ
MGITVEEIQQEAVKMLAEVQDGEDLDEQTQALIGLGVRAAVTTMDVEGTRLWAGRALDLGASPEQVHEVLALVSGLGVHTFFEGSRQLMGLLADRGDPLAAEPADNPRRELWDRYVGTDAYWARLEGEIPGFLDALNRLSPHAFEAFFQYCSLPRKTKALRSLTKELISIAADASPTHRYLPGMRLHVLNALDLGAGRLAILRALSIAAESPEHHGVR